MRHLILSAFFFCTFLPLDARGTDVIVTRAFTGLWQQTAHESQGFDLQIAHQSGTSKVAVAYWFTYGADRESAWFMGVGAVEGSEIEMTLYRGSGIGFLEDDKPGNDQVNAVGTLKFDFFSCTEGMVTFTTAADVLGSGAFEISRLTRVFNTDCSGGVSDDTPSDVVPLQQRISLVPARDGISGSGHADWEQRADRTEFSVEVEDLADGSYRIMVGGQDRGGLTVALGLGETEFRSPVEDGKLLLTFDPRDQLIEVHDATGAVLTSGDVVIDGPDGGGDPNLDFGTVDIEIDLENPGIVPLASGKASLEPRTDRTDFKVEIEDVAAGDYPLLVGGQQVGVITAAMTPDGVEGELEFRNPVEPGKALLDFDPRGMLIEVTDGSSVILSGDFPAN